MYSFLRGTLYQTTPISIVLDVGGIGYKIFVPPTLFNELPPVGGECTLHVSFVVREMSQTFYGFAGAQERDLFEVLTSVSGIGPKIGLALVGHMPLAHLKQALSDHDLTQLCKVPGIGKKTAQRLILEVKDKLPSLFTDLPGPLKTLQSTKTQDALSALIHLGYQQAAAQKAIQRVLNESEQEPELGALITKSLQYI